MMMTQEQWFENKYRQHCDVNDLKSSNGLIILINHKYRYSICFSDVKVESSPYRTFKVTSFDDDGIELIISNIIQYRQLISKKNSQSNTLFSYSSSVKYGRQGRRAAIRDRYIISKSNSTQKGAS